MSAAARTASFEIALGIRLATIDVAHPLGFDRCDSLPDRAADAAAFQ
jgi:hypothetical protein